MHLPTGSQAITIADYVFAPEYTLPKLSEVKAFVKMRQHLPGVVNEKEYLDDGIDLGSFLVSLQEKAEQSALYSIEQRKRLVRLRRSEVTRGRLEARLNAALLRLEREVVELEGHCASRGGARESWI